MGGLSVNQKTLQNRREKRKAFLLNHFSNDVVSLKEKTNRNEGEKTERREGGGKKRYNRDQYICLDIQISKTWRSLPSHLCKESDLFREMEKRQSK